MVERRIFYLTLSIGIVFCCWSMQSHINNKEMVSKKETRQKEKRKKIMFKEYVDEFHTVWSLYIKKTNGIDNSFIEDIQNNMRTDGFDGIEISNARHLGYKKCKNNE